MQNVFNNVDFSAEWNYVLWKQVIVGSLSMPRIITKQPYSIRLNLILPRYDGDYVLWHSWQLKYDLTHPSHSWKIEIRCPLKKLITYDFTAYTPYCHIYSDSTCNDHMGLNVLWHMLFSENKLSEYRFVITMNVMLIYNVTFHAIFSNFRANNPK